jgi:Domain of unknown function (DUF4160)
MPVVFRHNGLRFHFFSHEGLPREPVHIHVAKAGADAKLWLYPEVRVAYNHGLTPRELRDVIAIVTARVAMIEKAWNEHFA